MIRGSCALFALSAMTMSLNIWIGFAGMAASVAIFMPAFHRTRLRLTSLRSPDYLSKTAAYLNGKSDYLPPFDPTDASR